MTDTATRQDPERRVAASLAALIQQIDINDYRDGRGHDLKMNIAFQKAQALVDEFGFTHQDICTALDTCGDDMAVAAGQLLNGSARKAALADDEQAAGFSPPAG